jgi:hypothetical protein
MKPLSRRLRRSRNLRVKKESEVTAGTDMASAQQALQRAQRERAEVVGMRGKTEENARKAKDLLRKNHFAERIRRSFA